MSVSKSTLPSGPSLLSYLGVPIRLLLGGVFIYAAIKKLLPLDINHAPQAFSSSITAYRLDLPEMLVRFSAFAVPWTELIVGAMLIIGLFTRAAALITAAMLALFIALGISAIVRGLEIKCGCFGDRTLFCTGGLGWCHVIQNSGFLILAMLVVVTAWPALAIDTIFKRSSPVRA